MAKPKYKEYLERMLAEEKELFEMFNEIHAKYSLNEEKNQKHFNKIGGRVLVVVREWESRLVKNTERGMYSNFSTGLSEKFHRELKRIYPLIDNIGLIVEEPKEFVIKKINLG